MSSRLNIVVGIGAIALPFAAVAQMSSPPSGTSQPAGQMGTQQPTDQTGTQPSTMGTDPSTSTGSTGMQQPSTGMSSHRSSTASAGALKPVKSTDVKVGASVRDTNGDVVGKIESADSTGAVVSTGKTRAKIPLASLGKGENGLVVGMSRAELEAAAKEKSPK